MPFIARRAILVAAMLGATCGWATQTAASDPVPLDHLPALRGDYFPIRSQATGWPYHIYVRLPEGYSDTPDALYPVVYVTDGDSLFPILASTHLFLTFDDGIPEAIVVGIAYGSFDPSINRRHVDFTEASPGARDGAAAFQRFLKDELLPAVERRYRADPARRILIGQSRGGFMVLYSAFTDPDLFWGRIASNPSFEPGRERFFGPPPRPSRTDLRLAVVSGTRDRPHSRVPALAWFEAMAGRRDLPWALKAEHLEDGTHAADIARAYRVGMRWFFGASGDESDQASTAAHP
jgi:uncharacterized protein